MFGEYWVVVGVYVWSYGTQNVLHYSDVPKISCNSRNLLCIFLSWRILFRPGHIKAIKDEFSEQGLEGANCSSSSSSSRIDRHRESWPFAVSCLWRGGLNLVLIKKRYHRTKSSVTDVQLAFLDNWCRSFCPRIYFQLTFSVALTGRVGIGTNKLETPQFDIRSFRFVSLCPVTVARCTFCVVCHALCVI